MVASNEYRVQVGICVICHRGGPIHRHHQDYDKPLEVLSVCASCHKRIHLCLSGKQRTTSNPYINPLVKLVRNDGT